MDALIQQVLDKQPQIQQLLVATGHVMAQSDGKLAGRGTTPQAWDKSWDKDWEKGWEKEWYKDWDKGWNKYGK